jgi:23S rRNA (adenine2503-C2)-methyltransferase
MAAVREHTAAAGGLATRAYVAVGGLNLTPAHARALADLLAGVRAKVDLIDVNDPSGTFPRAGEEEIEAFRRLLHEAGIPAVRRYSGGAEIGAACGTLAATRRGGEVLGAG